ncbi:uncharacterized protein [Physcomitrium patens]|uniref:Uncharacterized protein n=1 Tax=Physcomitrium patens TaxID=3218 RepID=A0A2K1K7W9_PHYPA|nr:uncharacterized protein LOC112285432 isoform X2 [Physcomitrium patens]PNR49866.1 hypothetical protein PHYPA_011762 [Physcomitrium patens]|eukprot:XP_024382031.1 uncharacterized protein LOC112285432 isoform X2 [Physcomitrella patens]
MTAFGGFEPVFGKAQGRLESSPSHDLLPFLFYLRAKNSDHLLIHLTDFHANTWYSDMSTEYLEDMKDDIGIGGSWEDFITYVRAVFLSNNVTILLKGSLSAIASEGATSAKLVGQKAKGTPKFRVKLTKLQGIAATDAMGTISVEMFNVFRSQAASLSSETARTLQLSTAFLHEKARADVLQERLDALSFNKKKSRFRPMLAFDDPTMTQPLATQNTMIASVLEDFSTPGIQPTGPSTQTESKVKPATKTIHAPPRLRAAPIMRRSKRRKDAEDDDDE